MTALLINDAGHMTIERATTPRDSKRFRVLDAESGQPVEGVRLVAGYNFDWMSDWFVEGTTDDQGVATLRLARNYAHLLSVHAYAEGHIDRHHLGLGDSPGTGSLADDPVDIFLYREPPAGVGWRFPEGFHGTIVVGSTGRKDFGETVLIASNQPRPEAFRVPAAFPPGQRIWWSEITPNQLNMIQSPPRLGNEGRDSFPIPQAVTSGGNPVPIPDPGKDVKGVALWHVGVFMPEGPWGGSYSILVVGDHEAALAKAKELWEEFRNGENGYMYNGWVRLVSPGTKIRDPQPCAVTPSLSAR